jgi:hypothetical protein
MKILMVGKTGVFDTLAIALGYLNQPEINNCPNFADLALEKSKKLVKAGTDSCGNELYVVGFKIPKIIEKFNKDTPLNLSRRNLSTPTTFSAHCSHSFCGSAMSSGILANASARLSSCPSLPPS